MTTKTAAAFRLPLDLDATVRKLAAEKEMSVKDTITDLVRCGLNRRAAVQRSSQKRRGKGAQP